jgi:hypothetical protein
VSREYALVKPAIWNGKTGRAITRRGKDCRILADYVVTCPHANLIGLYYLPIPTMAHETGLTVDEVGAALSALEDLAFAAYDADAEVIWVANMAKYQLNWRGTGLTEGDKRAKAAAREYRECPDNIFVGPFFERYGQALHLNEKRGAAKLALRNAPSEPLRSPLHAPSKGSQKLLPDQDQEQEQEQEQDHEQEHDHGQDKEPEEKEGLSFRLMLTKMRVRQRAELVFPEHFESAEARDLALFNALKADHDHSDLRATISQLSAELWVKHQSAQATPRIGTARRRRTR